MFVHVSKVQIFSRRSHIFNETSPVICRLVTSKRQINLEISSISFGLLRKLELYLCTYFKITLSNSSSLFPLQLFIGNVICEVDFLSMRCELVIQMDASFDRIIYLSLQPAAAMRAFSFLGCS